MLLPFCLLNAATQAPLPSVPGLTWEGTGLASSFDGTQQPVIIGVPASYAAGQPTPLLVALHTWSADHRQPTESYGPEAAARGWLLVLPNFRGPNLTTNPRATEAGGSLAAQHDTLDAVRYMSDTYSVDADRVYMSGASGGGYMALLMAGKQPETWAAVVAWCPVTDLRDWHGVGNAYAQHIEAVCGGPPGASPEVEFEYLRRSPRTFITNAAATNILIGHGDRDLTIPTDQTWETFSRLRAVPSHHATFRSWCGGHEERLKDGLDWAAQQRRAPTPPQELHLVTDEAKGYFWLFLAPEAPLKLARAVAKAEGGTVAVEAQGAGRVEVDYQALALPPPRTVSLDGGNPQPVVVVEGRRTVALTVPDGGEHRWQLQ